MRITATQEQLQMIGIGRNIIGMECTYIKTFPDGWIQISIPPPARIQKITSGIPDEYYEMPSHYVTESN